MSRALINEYRGDLDRLRAVSGSRRESVLREAFKDLLKHWGKGHNLQFVPEHEILTPQKTRIYLDGALLHALRVPFGYWEAKDADDDLDAEIAAKTRKGYPRDNIIYSDDRTAVLIQNGNEAARVAMDDIDALYHLLTTFYAHERQEIADFNKAVKQFSKDLPDVLEALRAMIASKRKASSDFAKAEKAFLKHAQDAINPTVTGEDVQEMLIQHILTEDIFAKVFDNPDFHRQNNVAAELYRLEEKLFGRGEKSQLLRALAPYYSGIAATAAVIQNHSEKQGFLKGLYENFYKVYNEKAADRLGVVYTPGEIVRYMIRSTDWLCEKHFSKNLLDHGVQILDPATGTGTFIVELLEHFRGNHEKLRRKYKEELHANEIAILPYYVANLNIEATYQAITGHFAEFENLCFVDTLDNVDGLGINSGHQFDLLGTLTDENIERIKRQNRRKISVIIGNPPYNANQQNENDNNKNRTYKHIDQRIKKTYIKASAAQKTKLYDMYVRFLRWASDRLGEDGILAFVSNSSFVHKPSFDGVRATLEREFNELWVLDLKGDARSSGEARRQQGGNIFGDQIKVGVAVYILVKKSGAKGFRLYYDAVADYLDAEEKTAFLHLPLGQRRMDTITPDAKHAWVGHPTSELEGISIADKRTKATKRPSQERSIFKLFSLGISTNRDEWLYDLSREHLAKKVAAHITAYDKVSPTAHEFPNTVKWSETLKRKKRSNIKEDFDEAKITLAAYRPFSARWLYQSELFIDRPGQAESLFPPGQSNAAICFSDVGSRTDYCVLAVAGVTDLHFGAAVDAYQQVARFRYTKSGERVDNVTDWAYNKFVKHYGRKGVTKDTIFYYVYAVLHDPIYRETYRLNLKRDFPSIPFYSDFARWSKWGEGLMAMHIGYDRVEPWPVTRVDVKSKRAAGTSPKVLLKSDPASGVVHIDADTKLSGIPIEAWSFRLGNRSAIDWVIDQHKERKARDPIIAAKFNAYRFADHKESMVALLAKVVRVSVDTVAITDEMRAIDRKDY
ncbi:N-6 DNA methylase [Sinorhizobium meliloti]|nr:N-6 DNA methylase [Sinorhizobium meliloti]MDX0328016.1 N-6 DNA methylase [Sinorhizobium meliloti]